MNQFLEVAVEEAVEVEVEALTYDDGIAVATADAELASLESDFSKYETVVKLDASMDESALEGYAFGLNAPVSVIQSLISLEEDSKFAKIKDALVDLIKGLIKWVKTALTKAYVSVVGNIEKDVEFIKANAECSISDDDIKKAYAGDDKAIDKANESKIAALFAQSLLSNIKDENDNGYFVSAYNKGNVTFKNDKGEEKSENYEVGKELDIKVLDSTLLNTKDIQAELDAAVTVLADLEKSTADSKDNDAIKEAKAQITFIKLKLGQPKKIAELVKSIVAGIKSCMATKEALAKLETEDK